MAGFVQIIEYTTSRSDEIRALGEQMRSAREGDTGGPERITVVADRDHPGRFVSIVEFATYEAAMANSERAETSGFAAKMAELCDAPPTFQNLDVVQAWEPVAH